MGGGGVIFFSIKLLGTILQLVNYTNK